MNFRRFFLVIILYLISLCCFADDCSDTMSEAKDYYNKANYQVAKELFEYVKRECESLYEEAHSWILKCNKSLTPRLSVSRTSIKVGSATSTEYITVTCNKPWKIKYPSATMYRVIRNSNILTININENTSTETRSNYFIIETLDGSKSQKIELTQLGKEISATIHDVWIEKNDYLKLLSIHVKFTVKNMEGKVGRIVAYFYTESGTKLVDKNGKFTTEKGQVCVAGGFEVTSSNSTYNDFLIRFPLNELHVNEHGKYKFFISIQDHNRNGIEDSKWVTFSY